MAENPLALVTGNIKIQCQRIAGISNKSRTLDSRNLDRENVHPSRPARDKYFNGLDCAK